MYVFVVGFIIWLLCLLSKKLGLFDWLRTTYLYQTKAYQVISFVPKIYLYSFFLGKKDKNYNVPKVNLVWGKFYFIWILYFCVSISFVASLSFAANEYLELYSLKEGGVKVAVGTVHQLPPRGFRGRFNIILKDSKNDSLLFGYLMDESIMKGFKGKQATVMYIVVLGSGNKLISITVEGKEYGSVQEAITFRQDSLKGQLKWINALLLIFLILPWVFYKKYGLVRLVVE